MSEAGNPDVHVEVISIARARAYWLAVEELGPIGQQALTVEFIGWPGESVKVDRSRQGLLGSVNPRSQGDFVGDEVQESPGISLIDIPEGKVAIALARAATATLSLNKFYERTNEIYRERKTELKRIESIDDLRRIPKP